MARQFRHLHQDSLSGHHYKNQKKKHLMWKPGGREVLNKYLYREVQSLIYLF